MNDEKRNLEGSPSRDRFKVLHKQLLGKWCYALDSDLELIEKFPRPGIVARLDFKALGDSISFTEAIAYNEYKIKLAPIYIVEAQVFPGQFVKSDPLTHRFNIYLFKEADYHPNPPTVAKQLIAERLTWKEFEQWEITLRTQWRKRQ